MSRSPLQHPAPRLPRHARRTNGRRHRTRAFVASGLSAVMAFAGLAWTGTGAVAVTDEDPEFHVNRADLEFILKQIEISENHAEALRTGDTEYSLLCEDRTDLSGTCVPESRLAWGLRTVDGSFNNLMPDQERFGAGLELFPRLVAPHYRDAYPIPPGAPGGAPGTPTSYTQSEGFVYDPEPRIISNLIVDQTTNNPAAVAAAESTDNSVINAPTLEHPGDLVFTRLEESDPAVTVTEGWIPASTPDRRSGADGAYLYTDEAGASVDVAFEGSAVRWIAAQGPSRGVADVSVDGGTPVQVDLYSPTWAYQAVVFEATGLGAGEHTLTVTNTGTADPASAQARIEIDAVDVGTLVGATVGRPGDIFIPNESPDEGLSAPFSTWFTLFGQFFDHGLDMVSKGGNGTVVVPLQEDDPLYDPDGHTNFLMLTRATQHVDSEGVVQHENRTTPFVDQNQTYTSHPSHQVFIREYTATPDGPVPTGRLLNGQDVDGDGVGDGLTTWADVKTHVRTQLGIELDDLDVLDIPMVAADPYGRFIPGANGYPQLVVLEDPDLGDLASNRVLVEGDPAAPVDASAALRVGHAFLDDIANGAAPGINQDGTPAVYDAALLDSHYITGDGRGNENIGLSAVHHVFHAEHNRVVDHIKDVLAATGDADFIAKWQDDSGVWDYGERLFQAARFVTEMEYQHLVFEEFARTVVPTIDNQPLNETAYHADLNAAIPAEFAHVVYRFGHSMLTDTFAREGWGTEDLPLLGAFLNPSAFTDGGRLTPDQGAAAIIMGTAKQTGNGIDEFIVPTLRNNLLGLPLDLAAINMARARDTGMPTLQEARKAFWELTQDGNLKPYDSWQDFQLSLRHEASIVNFVAAYGDHPSIEAATTVDEKRAAAQVLVGDVDFMSLPASQSGLDDVDFWVGGLAEDGLVFGGILGSTFNYVFEQHLESLQNADRFYYLNRTIGLNLIHQLENNSFSELVMRTTDATLLPADIFASPDYVFDLTNLPDPMPAGLSQVGGVWRYDGEEHVVIHGTEAGESIRGDKGDDSIWGHGGDDNLEGGQGDDTIHGNAGNDVITDQFGDDTLHGGPGDDAINAGSGLDLIFGNTGSDFILHGNEITQSFAGADTDFVRGGNANDLITGNEGDDWLEGSGGHDLVQGDNALTFQNDPNGGADILYGGPGNDDHDAEGGDDIMLNNGIDRHAGMLGFDWVTHKHDPFAADSDLDVSIFQPPNVTLMRSRFFNIEGLSGWDKADVLRGMSVPGDPAFENDGGHTLTQAHLDRVLGLRELLGGGAVPRFATPFIAINQANNILLGGAGSDLIEGRAGDDFIDGDAALDVYLLGPGGERQESMQPFQGRIFRGELAPGDIQIVREIVTPGMQEGVIDTAYYEDVRANHVITNLTGGYFRVAHVEEDAGGLSSGVDILHNIERIVFADEVVDLVGGLGNGAAYGTIHFSTLEPTEDVELSIIPAFNDPDGVQWDTVSYTWQWADDEGEWTSSVDGVGTHFTPGDAEAGWPLRVIATFQDGTGTTETVTSQATLPVTNVNDPASGLVVDTAAPVVGDVVMGVGLADADGFTNDDGDLTTVLNYQWQVSDSTGGTTFTNIPGARAASLTVTEAHVGRQLRVALTFVDNHGTTESLVSPATEVVRAEHAPVATAGATALTFASLETGSGPVTQDVTITNTGDAPLAVGGLSIAGDQATSFLATSEDCAAVAAAGSCTITVTFAPSSAGVHTATLTVTHNAVGGSSTILLTGEATAPSVVQHFSDVPPTHPLFTEITWMHDQGLSLGNPNGTFGTTQALQRQAIAAYLYRYAAPAGYLAPATPLFSDVPAGHPFYTEIMWMADQGLSAGNPDGTFGTTQTIQRLAIAAYLYRLAAPTDYVPPATPTFSDVPTTHPYHTEIEWLASVGIAGTGGTFGPAQPLQRQDAARYLYRYDQLVGVVPGGTGDIGDTGGTGDAPGGIGGPATPVTLMAPSTARTTAGRSITFPLAQAVGTGPFTYELVGDLSPLQGTVTLSEAKPVTLMSSARLFGSFLPTAGVTVDQRAQATFAPAPGFTGTATLTYRVTDASGAVSDPVEHAVVVAGVSLTSNPLGAGPIAQAGPQGVLGTGLPGGRLPAGLATTGSDTTGMVAAALALLALGGLALRLRHRRA